MSPFPGVFSSQVLYTAQRLHRPTFLTWKTLSELKGALGVFFCNHLLPQVGGVQTGFMYGLNASVSSLVNYK